MSLPAVEAATTRVPFDIRRTRRSVTSALLEARKTFGGKTIDPWWVKLAPELARFRNLSVLSLSGDTTRDLAALAERNMELQLMVQESEVWLSSGESRLAIEHAWLVRSNETRR